MKQKTLDISFTNVLRHIQYLQQLVYVKDLALKYVRVKDEELILYEVQWLFGDFL